MNDALQELLDNPKYEPAGAPTLVTYKGPPITVYEEIKRRIFQALYSPAGFSDFANELSLVLARNFTLYETGQAFVPPQSPYNKGTEAFWGILCGDGGFRASSPADMFPVVSAQAKSSSFADIGFPQIWPCYQWKLQAAERFAGPFKAKTSFPILFVGGEYDPVTPLSSALKTSARFEGSVVLRRNGFGVR